MSANSALGRKLQALSRFLWASSGSQLVVFECPAIMLPDQLLEVLGEKMLKMSHIKHFFNLNLFKILPGTLILLYLQAF